MNTLNMNHFGCLNNTIPLVRSGLYFDLAAPRAADVRIEDIAAGLAKICRFGGHVDPFYSVAEHSVACAMAAMADRWHPGNVLAVLLHDAAEAYVGDMVKPLKIMLPEYSRIEGAVQAAIGEALGIDFEAKRGVIQLYDHALLIAEKRALFPADKTRWTGEDGVLHLDYSPQCWPPERAETEFLNYYQQLRGAR
jgi:hypothetical protein